MFVELSDHLNSDKITLNELHIHEKIYQMQEIHINS